MNRKKKEQFLTNTKNLSNYTKKVLHPASHKLHNFLKLAKLGKQALKLKNFSEKSQKNCDNCQCFSTRPLQFRASLSEESELVFGDEISLLSMIVDEKAILHIVDTAAHYSATTILDFYGETYGQTVEGIWLAFVIKWFNLFLGYPNRLRTDQESVFTSDRWKKLGKINGIELCLSEVKAHSYSGIG